MTDREKAIQLIRDLSSGKGFNWTKSLGPIERGETALRHWRDGAFTLGMEYGAMIALAHVFGITAEELEE